MITEKTGFLYDCSYFAESSRLKMKLRSPLLLLLGIFMTVESAPCRKLKLPEEASHVCVCTDSYCDEFDQPPESYVKNGFYAHYASSRDGKRLEVDTGPFMENPFSRITKPNPVVMRVDTSRRYQEMFGFGGAMTDSAGLNIATLSRATQEVLLSQYYGRKGIGYSFMRVPLAGTDFSTQNYTYADTENDFQLTYFGLKFEDFSYKIPYIKMAQRLSPVPIKLLSSSWSAPEWMKELRNGTVGFTRLRKQFYQLYADYYIMCLDEYKRFGLQFWGVSPQNEPFHGLQVYYGFNSMGWTPQEQREWIGNYFGPALHLRGYSDVKLLILDDNRVFLPGWADVVLADKRVREYVSGIAIHWYFDFLDPNGRRLSQTHYDFPEKFLLYTESSVIPSFDTTETNAKAVRLGNWERAENYTSNIIEDVNHWVTGWLDWNLALDTAGGPNWVNNSVDSPIIINTTANLFYKQPFFYALAHFSKFVPPGSRRIAFKISNDDIIECATFLRPDNIVAIVLQNRKDTDVDVVVLLQNRRSIVVPVSAHSMHTVLYRPLNANQGGSRPTNNPIRGNSRPSNRPDQEYDEKPSARNRGWPPSNTDRGYERQPSSRNQGWPPNSNFQNHPVWSRR